MEEQETVVFSNGKAGRCPIHNKTNPSGLNTYSCGCPIQYTKQRKEVKKNTNTHPTVKPLALMEYLVKLVSREGQVVLDPFMGSGTTGMACKKLDREFIGIEMMPEYMEIAKARIDGVKKGEQLNML
ncbi:MAG: Modification methylase DpnIIB [Parcubacteria group bacterium ADurb.Bin216]|nr:MAG: Modification methylase DpnIIB [Parcubacteria group bacterium ADurb.Bin216]